MNIVLVHGILGFSSIQVIGPPLIYFAGIKAHLEKRFGGARVFPPTLDPTAGVLGRSKALRQAIQGELLAKRLDPSQPIDIIAHSMGGLDARMLASVRPEIDLDTSTSVPVRTVVTIGTPHRGSPIADVVALRAIANSPFGGLLGIGEQRVMDALAHLHISLHGLRDLTSDQARTFNDTYHNHPAVRYRSFAARGRDGLFPVAAPFAPLHEYIRLTTGEQNDALVTVSSASWTGFDPILWPADHAEEVGHNLDRPFDPPPDWLLAKYESIVANL